MLLKPWQMAGRWEKGGDSRPNLVWSFPEKQAALWAGLSLITALNSQGQQDPKVPPLEPHLPLRPFCSSSKIGIQRPRSIAPCCLKGAAESPHRVLQWIDSRGSIQSCLLPSRLMLTPKKTLPSYHGLCQVAMSPWALSQDKEGIRERRGNGKDGGNSSWRHPSGLRGKVGWEHVRTEKIP